MFEPEVIYKDKDFLVLNKPAGLIVHGEEESVASWLLKNYPQVKNVGDEPATRPGIVHRLDKDTSGVLLVCLTQEAFDYFKKQFQELKIKKTYVALVYGVPKEKEGIIDKPISLKGGTVKRTVHGKGVKMTKEAVTEYNLRKVFNGRFSLLEVRPRTGRTHQIRVHLAAIGHPIVGDQLYGPKKPELNVARQFLHAESMEFTDPKGSRLKIAADLPLDLTKFLNSVS